MKILLCVPEYPPYHIGGGGEVFKNLAENYKKLGHDVTVIYGYYPTKSWWEDIKKYNENGIKFYQIPEIPYPKLFPYLRTVMPCNFKVLLKLVYIMKNERPDVVHIHGYGHLFIDYLGIICGKLKIRFVFTNHGYPKIPYKNKFIAILWNIYKNIIGERINRNAYKITCISEFTKNEYDKRYINKLVIIPNGIDLEYYKYTDNDINSLRNKFNIKNEKILLSVGRITEYKGFQNILTILNQIPNIKYIIVGEDQDYKNVLDIIIKNKNIKDKVIFTGKVDRNKLDLLYQLSDLVVIPSEVESFGLVGLESLKNKRCIISSGVQGLKYLKNSKNVYEFKTQQELINLLKKNIKYRDEYFIENFNWKEISIDYVKILTYTYEF